MNIALIKNLEIGGETAFEKDIEVNHLFDGLRRKLLEIRLQNGGVLSRHKADEPITVLCLSGQGVFSAGTDLDETLDMRPGTLITLEAGVLHQVAAKPAIQILVTKFKDS